MRRKSFSYCAFQRVGLSLSMVGLIIQPLNGQPCPVEWGPTVQISNTPTHAFLPKLAVVGDTVHVVYHAGSVYYQRSTDSGQTWGLQTEIVVAESVSATLWNRPLAAIGSSLYFVWENTHPSGAITSIKLKRSNDGGETWLDPQVLAYNGVAVGFYAPMVGAQGNQVFVTLNRSVSLTYQYFLTRSFDAGVTWDSVRQITSLPETHGGLGDFLLMLERAYLTFERATLPSGREIGFMVSTDSGSTWNAEVLISTIDNYQAWEPNVAADAVGGVYLSWHDAKYGSTGYGGSVLVRKSTNDGIDWNEESRVNMVPSALHSSLALGIDAVHVAWDDERYGTFNSRVYHSMSSDDGISWCNEMLLSDPAGESIDPGIAVSRNGVHCMWSDNIITPTPILYREGSVPPTGIGHSGVLELPDVALLQNYPNPFNDQTTIVYKVPRREQIRLFVVDLLGREVGILKDGFAETGTYATPLRTQGWSTGVYLLSLQGELLRVQRRITLIK